MSKILPVKGTRDFYPEDKAVQNWFKHTLSVISQRFGYTEFDGPEIEYIDLYIDKTSHEILQEQVFTLKDRDDRTLVLRPEITPTFARMVAQRSMELPKPIRWYSYGRAWRYEQPQKGRGREFFQWEINILGPESPEADAEILAIAATFLNRIKLSAEEVTIRVNDRSYFELVIKNLGIASEKFTPLLRIIDKKEKISDSEFEMLLRDEGLSSEQITGFADYLQDADYKKAPWLSKVFAAVELYDGVLPYVVYDPTVARGFDYYTRTVFEAWDKTGRLKRALFGGGRFDNLTETLGGERVPGVGMAPGDMALLVLLEELNRLPKVRRTHTRALVTVFDEASLPYAIKLGNQLRDDGLPLEIWPDTSTKLDKQIKYADKLGIPYVVLLGSEEIENKKASVKNLQTGEQIMLPQSDLSSYLQPKDHHEQSGNAT